MPRHGSGSSGGTSSAGRSTVQEPSLSPADSNPRLSRALKICNGSAPRTELPCLILQPLTVQAQILALWVALLVEVLDVCAPKKTKRSQRAHRATRSRHSSTNPQSRRTVRERLQKALASQLKVLVDALHGPWRVSVCHHRTSHDYL